MKTKLSEKLLRQLIREELFREYDRDEELKRMQGEKSEAISIARKNLGIVAAMLTSLLSTAAMSGDMDLRKKLEGMHGAASEIRQGLESL